MIPPANTITTASVVSTKSYTQATPRPIVPRAFSCNEDFGSRSTTTTPRNRWPGLSTRTRPRLRTSSEATPRGNTQLKIVDAGQQLMIVRAATAVLFNVRG